MVLMSVDLPQPFGPRIATCSPASTRRLKSSSATLSPRMTRTFFKSTRDGPIRFVFPRLNHKRSPRVPLLELSGEFATAAASISKALREGLQSCEEICAGLVTNTNEANHAHHFKTRNLGNHHFQCFFVVLLRS